MLKDSESNPFLTSTNVWILGKLHRVYARYKFNPQDGGPLGDGGYWHIIAICEAGTCNIQLPEVFPDNIIDMLSDVMDQLDIQGSFYYGSYELENWLKSPLY
jgi:hypothetical protein